MVVSEAKVVENPADKTPGTYIELTIANNDGTKLYIDVSKLVDNYTAASEAAQVKITISEDREISATLVEGGVDTDAIAANAVTKTKLGADVTESLNKADTAVQDIVTGVQDIDSTIPSSETAIVTELYGRINDLEDIVENSAASSNKTISDIETIQSQIAELKKDVEYLKTHVVYILENVD